MQPVVKFRVYSGNIIIKIALLLILLFFTSSLYAQEDVDNTFSLSLEELVTVKIAVPAALTKLTTARTPASITVITAEDIKNTPARNIYDLIEVYVPGAIWMNYEEGPVLGIRGSMTERGYKYLLRVNGRVMNNKGHYGAKSELEQWDLNDISRIEVIRGPGSVTYGPGAVAGIINIITHSGKTAPGLRISSKYVHEYNSRGTAVSYGYNGEKFTSYMYASVTRTEGATVRQFVGSNDNTPGFVGEDVLTDTEPLDYFGDYDDKPQVKVHLDTTFMDHWRIWLRYTQQGSHWAGNEVKTNFNGRLLNQQGIRDRQCTGTLQYDNKLRDDLSLSMMISADSFDVVRRKDNIHHLDPDHVLNQKTNFSETEIFTRGLLNWQAAKWVEIALGTEYSWDRFGPGWGDDEKDMRLGDDGVIVSGPDSNAMLEGSRGSADKNGTAMYVGDGWSTSTVSFFSEANFLLTPWLSTLFSGRFDKNTYSDWLFSPRIAMIIEFYKRHYLKLIGQQAQRMNTAGQLYALHQQGVDSDPETLTGYELIYTAYPNEHFSIDLAGFWNELEETSWNSDKNTTSYVGDLKVYGFESEAGFKWKRGKVGINYSYVKQYEWKLADGVLSSGVSYSDYNKPLDNSDGTQGGVGNDLNNWPNQSFKLFANIFLTKKIMLHVNGRVQWDFQGPKDGLQGLREAVAGEPEESEVLAAIQRAEDEDVYETQYILNASLSYEPIDNLYIRVIGQNLLSANDNKRYSFDTGAKKASPHRVRFIEEPRAYGVSVDYLF